MIHNKKLALVTGGTGGIGTAICQKLTQDGYYVIAGYYGNGLHEKALEWQAVQKEQGYDIAIQYGDIRDWHSCVSMIQDIQDRLGTVSVLVNCAGITKDSRLQRMSPNDWRTVLDTNLSSVFNVSKNVLDGMLAAGFGRIINISSINAEKGQFGQTNYSAAKAGMHGFTKALALEVASKGITVNTISPGYIETDMILAVPTEIRDKIQQQIPVGRFGKPEEVARVVAFLADAGSGFITGSNISVNGGHHMS